MISFSPTWKSLFKSSY